MLDRDTDSQTHNNHFFSGGFGGQGGPGHTGGDGGTGQGPIQNNNIETVHAIVNHFYPASVEVLPKALKILAVPLITVIFGMIIAYFDLVSLSTSSELSLSTRSESQLQTTSLLVPQVTQSVNNCPPPSRVFHGRQNILDKMHKYFNQNQTQQHIFLLHGIGGAGKTQIALKFIEASSCFSDIFLIDASTLETIDAGLKNIAVTKAGSTSQDALNWLRENHDQWLLLFDNADDPEINLNSFFPRCHHGNIIITSRNPGLRPHAGSDALASDMEETDAVKLLLRSAAQEVTPRNEQMAAEIVQELSCLPLAIIQAGAFIAKSGALNTYLGLYKQNKVRLLSMKPAQSHDDYGGTVYTTWKISFDRLSGLAQTLLQLCSFLHHRGISEEIFSKASAYEFQTNGPSKEELQKPMGFLSQYLGPSGAWDSLQFTEVTNQLRAYSLIDFNSETNLFSIHPLVHGLSQSTLADPEMYHYSMVAIVGMSITTIQGEDLQLLSHMDSLRRGKAHVTPDFNMQYGSIYYKSGRSKAAVELLTPVVESRRATFGEDDPETLIAMMNLGIAYNELGEFKKAEEVRLVVLEKQRKTVGEDNIHTLRAMSDLATTYHQLHRWGEAEKLEVLVLKKHREIRGEDHPYTLAAMGNLASTYYGVGRLGEAEKLQFLALQKQRKILGEDHLDTLSSVAALALTYHGLGRFVEAEELALLVLQKQKEILGENHLDTLKAMANLAVIYNALGQLNKAEELEALVLKKRREIYGEDYPDTLRAMADLAVTYQGLGRFIEAEKLEVLVLQKRKEIFGEDHPDTLKAMVNLAVIYMELGRLGKAEKLLVLILKQRMEILGDDHPDTLRTMTNLAVTYNMLGRLGEAEKLQGLVVKRQREIYGEGHPRTLKAIGNLATTYHRLGRLGDAEKLNILVLKQQREIYGEDHADTLRAMGNLASTYHSLGKLGDAEKLQFLVLEKCREIYGEDHPDTLRAMGNLASIYHGLGRFTEAEKLKVLVTQKQREILGENHPDTRSAVEVPIGTLVAHTH